MSGVAQNWTNALTHAALADRLRIAADAARSYTASERKALMREAASRLDLNEPREPRREPNPVIFPMPSVVDQPVYLPDGSVDHRPRPPRPGAVVFAIGTEADPTPGVSDLHPCSSFEHRAAAHLSMWLRGRRDLERGRQWLQPSTAGEIIVAPTCFRSQFEARVIE